MPVELSEEAHRFLSTVALAASDATCGFLPTSVTSPVANALGKQSGSSHQGVHTTALLNALPPSVTIQMVDMGSLTANHLPIKAEFMEAFNSIYAPPLPPLVAMPSGSGGGSAADGGDMMDQDLPADLEALDLPPLEECIFPPLEGEEEDDSWDFAAALEMIFDTDKGQQGGKSGGMIRLLLLVKGWGNVWHLLVMMVFWLCHAGGAASSSQTQAGQDWFMAKLEVPEDDDDSPLKLFYDDALQR